MSFFLLARTDDGKLHLLSEESFQTARKAQAYLSQLSSDPGFPHFDDEVVVMDLDKGTPILLVRPAGAPAAADEVEESIVAEEDPEEGLEAVGDEAIADEIVAEAEEAEEADAEAEADTEPEDDEAEELEDEEAPSLKDALSRTAASMEAEGITPPESVGAADEAEEPEPVAEQDETPEEESAAAEVEPAAWPWDASSAGEDTPQVALEDLDEPELTGMAAELIIIDEGASGATEGGEIVTVPAGEEDLIGDDMEVVSVVEPAGIGGAVEDDMAETVADEAAEDVTEAVGEETVEESAAAESEPFVLDDLEAPAVSVSPLIPTGADDEMMALSHPVIMDADTLDQAFESAVAEPAAASDSDDISDFIRDLEQITEIPEAAHEPVAEEEAPAPPPSKGAMLPGVTCDDCIYEPTCPNKESRTPQQCGSFQWKSV